MTETNSLDPLRIDHWIKNNFDQERIRQQLAEEGSNVEYIDQYLQAYKKKKQLRKQGFGFIYIAVGSVIGFIGCVTAMLNPMPEYYHHFLYGFGTLSVIILFFGLYQVFE